MHRTRLLAFVATLALAGSAACAAETALPAARVARFSGDRAAALTYTFDDGLRDQYTLAVPMLNEVGLKGTFFVIPGKISETVEDAEKRKNDKRAWGTITWGELKEMAGQGHEIASHTWTHPGLAKLPPEEVDAQFSKAADAILVKIGKPALTLAFPFNQSTPEIETTALKHHVAFRDSQLGIGGKTTAESLDAWADKQVRARAWGVAMLHAIGSGYAALSDPEIFRTHLRRMKARESELWVDTFANVARYVKERDTAKLVVTDSSPGRLVCMLTSDLPSATYDVPLTLVFEISGAKTVRAERAGRELSTRVLPASIQIDVAPAAEPITLVWQ